MRKMPIGIQSFEDLRSNDYVYVDKTSYVFKLVSEGKSYFLGRPRRFGKSLLLSTLKAYFQGQKELFEGLAIEKLEKEWVEYPVLHIDITGENFKIPGSVIAGLDDILKPLEEKWNPAPNGNSPSARFLDVIRYAYEQTGKKVVVLIDEYDKPLLETIEDEQLNGLHRDDLRAFYGTLKKADQYLKFVLLTGVTKFSQVSVFSDLNQLFDISMNRNYAGMCGISYQELTDAFVPELTELAESNGMTYEETVAEMKKKYDGYHFCNNSVGIFNPFSVLSTFINGDFRYYWFKTGTPTFLLKLIQDSNFDVLQFQNGIKISTQSIDDYRVGSDNPVPILYQSGYLTIKGYEALTQRYLLGFPNEEVEFGFLRELLPYYTKQPGASNGFSVADFIEDLNASNIYSFMTRLKAFFANIPYELNDRTERHYQVVFYLIFTLMGQFTKAEVHSAKGRADAVVELPDAIYVFEFKLLKDGNGDTAEAALKQIDDKGYMIPYTASGRRLMKVGIQFDADERNIQEWKVVEEQEE
jgi:hypothetical protein